MHATTLLSPVLLVVASAPHIAAQIDASQSRSILNDLVTQLESIIQQPAVQTLRSEIASDVPISVLRSAEAAEATGFDLSAFATNPNAYLSGRVTAWETILPSDVRSAYDAYQTSLAHAQASLVNEDLNGAAGTSAAMTTSMTVSGAATTTGASATAAASTGAAVVAGPAVLGVAGAVMGAAGFVAAIL